MGIKFIIGRSGSGKSYVMYEELVKKAIENPEEKFIIIVPEQFTMQTQRKVIEKHPRHGVTNIDILSFERLAYSVFNELGMTQKGRLDDTGKSLVLRKIIYEQGKNLEFYGSKKDMPGFTSEVKSVISEFGQYGVNDQVLENMLKATDSSPMLQSKLKDIQLLNNAFKDYIQDKFMTPEDMYEMLGKVIMKAESVVGASLYFDGFTGFTPVQYNLITELMHIVSNMTFTVTLEESAYPFTSIKDIELFNLSKTTIKKLEDIAFENGMPHDRNADIIVGGNVPYRLKNAPALTYIENNLFRFGKVVPYTGNDSIEITTCDNPKEEAEFVATKICELVRGNGIRFREIAVVTGDLSGYRRHLEDAFLKYEVPAFIDNKRSILDNPFVDSLKAVMEIIEKNYSYESVFHYLKRSLWDYNENEIFKLENYVLNFNIHGRKNWKENFTKMSQHMEEEELVEINSLRQRIYDEINVLWDVFKNPEKKATVEDCTKALYDFCLKKKYQEKLHELSLKFEETEDLSLAKEYEQTYQIVMNLFDSMIDLMGNEVCSVAKYKDIFSAGLENIKVGVIPAAADQVMVGDIERTRLEDVKVLFLIGVNDGVIPQNAGKGGIITEAERRILEEQKFSLAPDERKESFIQRFYLYNILTKPSEFLYISYAKTSSDGKSLNPSYLIGKIKSLCVNVKHITWEDEKNKVSYIYNEKLGIDYLALVYGRDYNKENNSLPEDGLWNCIYNEVKTSSNGMDAIDMIKRGPTYWNRYEDLDSQTANTLYSMKTLIGITTYERYAKCPYMHFLDKGIGLQERKVFEVSQIDIGNMYHDTLEQFLNILQKKNIKWHDLNDEIRESVLQEALDNALNGRNEVSVFKDSKKNKGRLNRISEIIRNIIIAMEKQIKAGKFEPMYSELPVKRGRVDRVDIFETSDKVFFRVIDYKTGTTVNYSLQDTYYKMQLQLFAYMNDVEQSIKRMYPGKEIVPVGSYYFKIKEEYEDKNEVMTQGVVDDEKVLEKLVDSAKLLGPTLDLEEALEATDTDFATGASKKTFVIKKGTDNLSVSDMGVVRNNVEESILEMREDMLSGNNTRHPFRKNGDNTKSACAFCAYTEVCGFNEKENKKHKYNDLTITDKKEILEKMRGDDGSGLDK